MTLWRLTREPFADLHGEGARRYGGRWNSPGRPVVYLSADPSTTVLEVLVNLDLPPELLPSDYVLMGISANDLAVEVHDLASSHAACRTIGDRWLAELRTPLLRVPSVVVEESANYLLNPLHPDASGAEKLSSRSFTFDPRLLA